MLKGLLVFTIFLAFSTSALPWGLTGHRVVAKVAEKGLDQNSKKLVKDLLGKQTLSSVSNWLDDFKSISGYDYVSNFHYINISKGEDYWTAQQNPEGDALKAICYYRDVFVDKNSTKEQKLQALKLLVHVIGDIHQPLHVGMPQDKGGNTIIVYWFDEKTTFHMVWDEKLIDSQKLSYTEYVDFIYFFDNKKYTEWKKADVMEWVTESLVLRDKIYEYLYDPKKRSNKKYLSYKYRYDSMPDLNLRLLQAGIRLGGFINDMVAAKTVPFCLELKKSLNGEPNYGIPKVL